MDWSSESQAQVYLGNVLRHEEEVVVELAHHRVVEHTARRRVRKLVPGAVEKPVVDPVYTDR